MIPIHCMHVRVTRCNIKIAYPFCSRLFYDITHRDPSRPVEHVVRRWIDKLNEVLHCGLKFTHKLSSSLIQRANFLRWKMKNKGGRQRENILTQNWTLTSAIDCDATSSTSPSEDVTKLTHQVKSLQSQVQATSHVL